MQIGKKSESAIEGRLRDRVKLLGGRCLKFVSPGQNGVPDRIILLPGGRVVFAELKAPALCAGSYPGFRLYRYSYG